MCSGEYRDGLGWKVASCVVQNCALAVLSQVKVETCSSGGEKLFLVRFLLLEIWELALKLLVNGRHSSFSAVEFFSSVCKLTLRLDVVWGRLDVGGNG